MTRPTITPEAYRAAQAKAMTEDELLAAVRSLATALGWLVYHTHRSDRSEAGFPDLTLVKAPRLVFAELKTAKGNVSVAQDAWLHQLAGTPAEVFVWRPGNLLDRSVLGVLTGRG